MIRWIVIYFAAPILALGGDWDFYESNIRPLLAEHCYECHSQSAKDVKGGLRLDRRRAWESGGHSGPAIVPGDPAKSLLIQAVRHQREDLKMPANNPPLAEAQIKLLETWIAQGAPAPLEEEIPRTDVQESTTHWAFQPIDKPAIPEVGNQEWIANPIDAFVLEKLESNRIKPSPPADRRTLLRRLYFTLTGVYPAFDEVRQFESDQSPEAYARRVQEVLSSPRYGERWARHWLDVARYADTKGYVFESERRYPYAYTYRDYVIRAFNEDMPFDTFLKHQLAADLMPLGEDKRPLAALGYLTLGRRFLNNQHDIIDDRIDVVTRGMMGLTVHCARCHDHKYDPIPTEDYYSLYGVFASSREPDENPLLGETRDTPAHRDYLKEKREKEKEINEFETQAHEDARKELRRRADEYLLTAHESSRFEDDSKMETLARERKLEPSIVSRWIESLKNWSRENHPVMGLWSKFAELPAASFAEEFKKKAGDLLAGQDGNAFALRFLMEKKPVSLEETAKAFSELFHRAHTLLTENATPNDSGLADSENQLREIQQILYGENAPANPPDSLIPRLFDVKTGQKLRRLNRELAELESTHPGAPPRAMALEDLPEPREPKVFVRGNSRNPGKTVPRQFLQALSNDNRRPFQNGSGRLELAKAIASPSNPLTARVIVNRVWLHHFGQGLVDTPSDFGTRSNPPSHPELLDYLAAFLIDNGWSIKKLHALILNSNTFRQSSRMNPDYQREDPDNRLLSRMNRRRLDFESMRDNLLALSDRIDWTMGGHSEKIDDAPDSRRRSIYGFIDRQNLPALFRTFDFASPDTSNPGRFATNVPQQALYLMNSPFIVRQAKDLSHRLSQASINEPSDKIALLYQILYQRVPGEDELAFCLQFLETESRHAPDEPPDSEIRSLGSWTRLAQALLASNEMFFVD